MLRRGSVRSLVPRRSARRNVVCGQKWLQKCLAIKAQEWPPFDPDNGEVLFARSSTRELVFSWFLLSLCQRRRLVDLGTRVLGQSWICRPGNPLSKVLLSSVKQSAFAHFCGGESLEDCVVTGKQLEAHAGVKCIVDWGVEESSDAKFWDSNTERKVKTLHRAKEVLGSNAAFMPIKLTSLLSPALLERITLEVNHDPNAERGIGWQAWQDEPEAADALQRLRCLCEAAKSLAIPLLLDAEQSDRQAAVHLLARHLQAEFNVQEPIVYDTIQMYLKASPQRLEEEVIESLRYQSGPVGKKPWMGDNNEFIWSDARIKVAKFVWSQGFETTMGLIIVGNLVLIMWEADQDAKCFPDYRGKMADCPDRSELIGWLQIVNIVLLLIYSVECLLRGFVDRARFFCNTWNVIDFLTVVLGWLSALLTTDSVNLNMLRLSRLVRVVRAARVFISVPELYLLISGLYSSIKAIIFGSLMLATVISFWAVISVELFHPEIAGLKFDNCDRCANGFQSVFQAGLTLFQQIVAGDSWGQISIPLIDVAPWTAPFLFFIMMTVSLGVMNLILAVIVERAAEARANDQERKQKQKEEERARNMVGLATLCASMDMDGSGSLSLEEMLEGFETSEDFQKLMHCMDIQRDDVQTIFNVLDEDRSGEVSYLEFCKHLGSFFERDPKIIGSVVKYSMMEIKQVVKEEVMDVLQLHTKMLQEQRLLLDKLRYAVCPAPVVPPVASVPAKLAELVKGEAELPSLQSLQNLLSLETAQLEIEPLLSKAEGLAATALLDTLALLPDPAPTASAPLPRRMQSRSASRSRSFRSGSEHHESEKFAHELSGKLEASKVLGQELEERFARLCARFQERMGEAETVHDRCRKILAKLEAMKGGLVQDLLALVVEEQL